MIDLPGDIQKRLEADFGEGHVEARRLMEEMLGREEFSPRIYRCVLVLAGGRWKN